MNSRFGFKKRTIKLLDKNQASIHKSNVTVNRQKKILQFFRKSDEPEALHILELGIPRRKVTVPISPKSHLKERAQNREVELNKT